MKLVFKNILTVTLKTQNIFSPPVVLWNTNKLMNVGNKVVEGTHGDRENPEHDQFNSALDYESKKHSDIKILSIF